MYAVVIDNKFTGVVYSEITDNVRDWCDEMDATLIKVFTPPVNIGTEDEPDYGSPSQEQLSFNRIAELKEKLRDTDYITLPDYDKDKPEILTDRQAWRDEIRQLEQSL